MEPAMTLGKALLVNAIKEGENAKPFTQAQLDMALEYLDELRQVSIERGDKESADVVLVQQLPVHILVHLIWYLRESARRDHEDIQRLKAQLGEEGN